ncbi:MAG TPA: DNA mismatch repair protein MutL, partial [Spirochaetales bacterium]|nr:DNA mismatch repair protein MutL [Spirochaetales bacterium]
PESADEDRYLRERAAELDRLGFRIRDEGGTWLLETAPAILPESRTGAIFEVLKRRPDPDALVRETAARAACRSAIMDGEALDPASAQALLSRAMDLPDPHCPHGRPIWLRLSRDDLYRAVRRIV